MSLSDKEKEKLERLKKRREANSNPPPPVETDIFGNPIRKQPRKPLWADTQTASPAPLHKPEATAAVAAPIMPAQVKPPAQTKPEPAPEPEKVKLYDWNEDSYRFANGAVYLSENETAGKAIEKFKIYAPVPGGNQWRATSTNDSRSYNIKVENWVWCTELRERVRRVIEHSDTSNPDMREYLDFGVPNPNYKK